MRNELTNYKDLLGGIKARVRQGQIWENLRLGKMV